MPRNSAPKNETPQAAFVREGTAKVNTILRAAQALGKLGGKKFASTPEQRKKIQEAIQAAFNESFQRLAGTVAQNEFKL